MRHVFPAIACLLMASAIYSAEAWRELEPGLELGSFKIESASVAGDSTVTVVRADPQRWDMKLLCASQEDNPPGHTPLKWCEKYNLVAAINAGMFDKDFKTHTGFLQTGSHINNSTSNHYLSAAAFGPKKAGLAQFRIFDLEHMRLDQLKQDYQYVVQNLRLIKRPGENVWLNSDQEKKWSEAALGEDSKGRALLIFCRSPYPMVEFNRILLSLPLDLVCAQHLEGGQAAELSVNLPEFQLRCVGSYETTYSPNDWSQKEWVLPNVIGISRKETKGNTSANDPDESDTTRAFAAPAQLVLGAERDFPLGQTGLSIRMCWIPSGESTIVEDQDSSNRSYEALPERKIKIEHGFWMSKFELTQAQWIAVCGKRVLGSRNLDSKLDQYPIWGVSEVEVRSFIERLWKSIDSLNKSGTDEQGIKFRLPDEAEWEYACRAGTTTRYYWGGGEFLEQAGNCSDCRMSACSNNLTDDDLHNRWGLHDIGYGIFEWCFSIEGVDYSSNVRVSSEKIGNGDMILRGGTSLMETEDPLCESAARFHAGKTDSWNTVVIKECGIRLVAEMSGD